jgi:hypothetical protein
MEHVKKGFSNPMRRKTYFEAWPHIHFSVPIVQQSDSETTRSTDNPLLQDLEEQTRYKSDTGFIWQLDGSTIFPEGPYNQKWEKANFMAWLIREDKYQRSLKQNLVENADEYLDQTLGLASRLLKVLLDACSDETVAGFKKCTEFPDTASKADQTYSQLKRMFDNILNEFWNSVQKKYRESQSKTMPTPDLPRRGSLKEQDLVQEPVKSPMRRSSSARRSSTRTSTPPQRLGTRLTIRSRKTAGRKQ